MKLLIDENLPKRLKNDFPEHDIYTVADLGWTGIKNGQLLKLMTDNGFDAFLTFDKNLQYQQNFRKYSVTVFILVAANNTYKDLTKLSGKISDHLKNDLLPTGIIIIRSNWF